MYGSDYPIFNPPVTIAPLEHYGFSSGDMQAVNRGNAEKLFPRFKQA
jgi:predicted TIM-barrel fold metal-dependent hydrolase